MSDPAVPGLTGSWDRDRHGDPGGSLARAPLAAVIRWPLQVNVNDADRDLRDSAWAQSAVTVSDRDRQAGIMLSAG